MAQQIINDGESGLVVRTKINENDTELYAATEANAIAASNAQNSADNAQSTANNAQSSAETAQSRLDDIEPRPVVLDTDWWTDVDDAVAMRIALWGENQGIINIMAVCINAIRGDSVGSLDAFFQAEGRKGINIGVDFDATDYDGNPPYQDAMISNNPYSYTSYVTAEDATRTYRRAIVKAIENDKKIDIISIGYLNNIEKLMKSLADDISPLTGMELISAGVNKTYIMGGQYPSGSENNFNRTGRARAASEYVVNNYELPITFLGFEVGNTVFSGQTLKDIFSGSDDILLQALINYGASITGRESWDPLMLLVALFDEAENTGFQTFIGDNVVNGVDGSNVFTLNDDGRDRYVVKDRTDTWFEWQLNTILEKRSWTYNNQRGLIQLEKPDRGLTATDKENLRMWYNAEDCGGYNDTNLMYQLQDRSVREKHLKTIASFRPIYRTSIGGKECLQFDGLKRIISDLEYVEDSFMIYANVYFDILPGSNQSIIGQDTGSGSNRYFHLKVGSGGQLDAVTFDGSSGIVNSQPGVNINEWFVLTAKITPTELEAYLDGVSSGATTITGHNVGGNTPVSLGTRQFNGLNEALVGYVNEVRIYKVEHDQATIDAVVAEMK